MGCLLFATSAVGCKDKCVKACEHMADCMGVDGECDDAKCSDADDKGEAKDAAKCINDLSCDEVKDPVALAKCAE